MPRVSVIVPTWNRAPYLGAAIESVLAQTYTDFELFVVDDGSTDQTRQVISRYEQRLRYLYLEHQGLIGAVRNQGIRLATGPYIAFLDSDDLWEPEKLALQVAHAELHPEHGLIYTGGWFFDDATNQDLYPSSRYLRPEVGWAGEQLLQLCFIQTPSVLIRRTVLEQVGYFCEEPWMHAGEDWDLWLRVAARYQIGYIAEPLIRVRIHGANSTERLDPLEMQAIALAVIERACAFAPELYAPLRDRAILTQRYNTIANLIQAGCTQEARLLFADFIHAAPALTLSILRELKASGRARR